MTCDCEFLYIKREILYLDANTRLLMQMKNDTINPATYLNPFYSIDLKFMAWLILRVIYYWAVLFQWRCRGEMEHDMALMGISFTYFWLIGTSNL